MVQHGGCIGQVFAEAVRRTQPRARGKDVAQIMRESLIYPEQVALHRVLIVRRGQARGTAILAIPGVYELMRKKVGFKVMGIGIAEHIFRCAVVAGLMVFQTVMGGLVPQNEKEVVFFVVSRAKKFACFCYKLFQAGQVRIRHLDGLFAFANQIDHMNRRLTRGRELYLAVNRSGDQRRVNQFGQRDGLEFSRTAGLLRGRERCAELPSIRQPDRSRDLYGVRGHALRIQQDLVPDQVQYLA